MLTDSQEHFWGVELSKDKPSFTWTFKEEDEDEDYLVHTLFLKNAVLGSSALKGERNIIQVETQNFEKKDVKQALLSLTLGQTDMCNLDVSFGHETPVTFRLVEGCGPVALGGQQLVEFPPEEMNSQDESALDDSTMESELTEELTEEDMSPKASRKRKAARAADKKKGKMDESVSSADSGEDEDEDDEEDDEEDDDDEESMEDDDETSSPEKKKKKGKDTKGKKGRKTTKTSPKKAAKKTTKKGKK